MKCPFASFLLLTSGFSAGTALLFPQPAQAQQQDSVEIKGERTPSNGKEAFTAGQTLQTMSPLQKKLYQNSSLSYLLSEQSSVFVKTYGVNGLATLTFRGASAAQSAVLWNGIPIQNPGLGVSDISLLNTGLFDQIQILYGSAAALWGSGNVGGALYLQNGHYSPYQPETPQLQAGLFGGSFGLKGGQMALNRRFKKGYIKLKGMMQHSRNNFSYTDADNEKKQMTNARLTGGDVLLSAGYRIAPGHMLYTDVWTQQYNREIPPALFERSSVKNQKDRSVRALAGWDWRRKPAEHWQAKVSYNIDQMQYADSLTATFSDNKTAQYYHELSWEKEWPSGSASHRLLLLHSLQYTRLLNNDTARQLRPAIAVAYAAHNIIPRIDAALNARQEWNNGAANPFLIGAGAEWKAVQSGNWQAGLTTNIQKTYRLPSLNELYYQPGGNTQLKPEHGWNTEAGYKITYQGGETLTATHQLNGYSRHISDWIYWLGGAVWTPHNIAKVYSRGIETSNHINFTIQNNVNVDIGLQTAYTLSTTQTSYLPADSSIGRQIPYTPRYSGHGAITVTYKNKISVLYSHNYDGYRFITTDESQYLKPYYSAQLFIQYSKTITPRQKLTATCAIRNLWDRHYQVVAFRPMPGRNFQMTLQWEFF